MSQRYTQFLKRNKFYGIFFTGLYAAGIFRDAGGTAVRAAGRCCPNGDSYDSPVSARWEVFIHKMNTMSGNEHFGGK
jgi:hypothetical protein